MIFALRSHIGQVRQNNEDSAYIPSPPGESIVFIAVADGMGGHKAGEMASRLAIEALKEQLGNAPALPAKLVSAIKRANATIFEHSQSIPAIRGMGTTITAAIFDGGALYVANVGDSRAYKLSGDELTQITVDHSLVEELVLRGQLTREQALIFPQRNVITRALGTEADVNVDVFEAEWSKGDILLLCTDGLTTHLLDADIHAILGQRALSLDERAEMLIGLANERGGRDNITVALAEFVEVDV